MKRYLPAIAVLALVLLPSHSIAAGSAASPLWRSFAAPPMDARPAVRWWWFGPAVVKPELGREMALMREGGFGGFEVQPTYPLALDGQYPELKNLKFLSPEFNDMLGFTAARAHELGLRMELTLGSGWPYGGPMFTREEAAQSIADGGTVSITADQATVTAPVQEHRGKTSEPPVIAALLGPVNDARPGESPYLPLPVQGRTAQLPADRHGATHVRFFVYAPAGLMQVKRAAYGDEGFIVDHYNPQAVEKFIREIAAPEIAACGTHPPDSVFCDSLEIVGEGWTPGFPAYFQQRYGYDLVPLLPALFDADFPHAAEIRGDYGAAIAARFDEAFVRPFAALARQTHTQFRLQAYGTPPTTLSTYAHVDIDEGENFNWRVFSGLRWAASASHVLGRTITSSEAFTWLHSPVFMAAPIDIKAESNLQFLSGVNQLLYHGWPYTAPGVEYPGWRFYAAAVFNEKNPWWIVMPEINDYLARTSQLLRQGQAVNDIAVYLPEEDAFAAMTPSNLQMVQAGGNGILNRLVNPLVPVILDAGYNFDGIDAGVLASQGRIEGATLAFGDSRYRMVVLPRMSRITAASLRTLEAFANAGGVLIAVDAAPSLAPGYHPTEADARSVREISARLFTGPDAKGVVVPFADLPATLRRTLTPDVRIAQAQPAVGFLHREAGAQHVYFFANTTNQPVATTAELRVSAKTAAWWDATTATKTAADLTSTAAATMTVALNLAPYEARFLITGDDVSVSRSARTAATPTLDLSHDWNLSFKNAAPEPSPAGITLRNLGSWTDLPETRHFAGVATYTKTLSLSADQLSTGATWWLDFGSGVAGDVAGGPMGMHAQFQPAVADAAVIYVNGRKAGALWCPPYRVDVSRLLRVGENELRIEVANRASNYLADTARHPLPDYSALNADKRLGGNRFQPQDLAALRVTPSGLLGPISLVAE